MMYMYWHVATTGVIADPRGDGDWIKLNVNQFGYYRVNYDERMWADLSQQLLTEHTVCPCMCACARHASQHPNEQLIHCLLCVKP